MGVALRVLDYVLRRMARPEDTNVQVRQKAATLLMLFGAILLNTLGLFTDGAPLLMYYLRGSIALFLALAAHLWFTRRQTPTHLCLTVVLSCLSVTVSDFADAPLRIRHWPLFVLVCDFLLVIGAPRWMSMAVVLYVCVYVAVIETENCFRVGLFDAPWMYPYNERRDVMNCARPPCSNRELVDSTSAALSLPANIAAPLLVFVMDYMFTRGFAGQATVEKERMQAAIRATERVAKCLSTYDLEQARDILAGGGECAVPAELADILSTLLDNLGSYRPFLPQGLFDECDDNDGGGGGAAAAAPPPGHGISPRGSWNAADVPGLIVPRAAILFTDIRSSTLLWETCDAMAAALALHNSVIRAAINEARGYEVKTIGDAFMVAYHNPWDAVCSALKMQTDLLTTAWPAGLTLPGPDGPAAIPLMVRIGVHWAEVRAEESVLTGRFDYFGPAVNKASRVESLGCPGAVTVTDSVRDELAHESYDGELAERACVYPYTYPQTGKGLLEELYLTALVPKGACETVREEARAHAAARPNALRVHPLHRGGGKLSGAAALLLSPGSTVSTASSSTNDFAQSPGQRVTACVGVVRFASAALAGEKSAVHEASHVSVLHGILGRTSGHLALVINNTAYMSWGVYGSCRQPVNASVRCLGGLSNMLQGWDAREPTFYAGLGTGAAASGRVTASKDQRFLTLLGPCVDLSAALCTGAAELGTALLVASAGSSYSDSFDRNEYLKAFVRPVDSWTVDPGVAEAGTVDVFELRIAALSLVLGDSLSSYPSSSQPSEAASVMSGNGGPVPDYARAFFARDLDALHRMAEAAPEDAALASVVALVQQGSHLPHAILKRRAWGGLRVPQQRDLLSLAAQSAQAALAGSSSSIVPLPVLSHPPQDLALGLPSTHLHSHTSSST